MLIWFTLCFYHGYERVVVLFTFIFLAWFCYFLFKFFQLFRLLLVNFTCWLFPFAGTLLIEARETTELVADPAGENEFGEEVKKGEADHAGDAHT